MRLVQQLVWLSWLTACDDDKDDDTHPLPPPRPSTATETAIPSKKTAWTTTATARSTRPPRSTR